MSGKAGAKPIRGHFQTASGRVGFDLTHRSVHAHQSHGHPAAFNEVVLEMMTGGKVRANVPHPDRGRLNLAALHSAHLLLFREFGYGYLLTPGGQWIRSILHSVDRLDDPPFMGFDVPRGGDFNESLVYKVGVYSSKGGDRCLFAALPVPDPRLLCQLVLLPGPRQVDLIAYQAMVAGGERWMRGVGVTISGGPERKLEAPEFADGLFLLWEGMTVFELSLKAVLQATSRAANGCTALKVDLAPVARRFGMSRDLLAGCVWELVDRGLLNRLPKRKRPFIVRLTEAALNPQ
jgi:hypothetical protein